MRRFVVVGRTATASADFSRIDVAGSSGRLDVLLRCIRAALCVSHGIRHDTVVYLVLLGGPRAPRTLRFDGARVNFIRPDERTLAVLVHKTLAAEAEPRGSLDFAPVRRGLAMADGGLDAALADISAASGGAARFYVLDERGADVRAAPIDLDEPAFVVGDHLGLDDDARAALFAVGAVAIGVGPVSLHADDAIAVVLNEVDRRRAKRG